MVKSDFSVSFAASEIVVQRTVPLSEKPHLGAQLFESFVSREDVFPDLELMDFERSIFGRLPSTQLRKSEKLDKIVITKEQSLWTESRAIVEDLHALVAQSKHEDVFNLAAEGNQNRLILSASRDELITRLYSPKSSWRSGGSGAGVQADKIQALVKSLERMMSDLLDKKSQTLMYESIEHFHNKDYSGFEMSEIAPALAGSSMSNNRNLLECLLLSENCNLLSLVNVCGRGEPMKGTMTPISKLRWIQSTCNVDNKGAQFLGERNEVGFGTSPIWYQQSMETGPPLFILLA